MVIAKFQNKCFQSFQIFLAYYSNLYPSWVLVMVPLACPIELSRWLGSQVIVWTLTGQLQATWWESAKYAHCTLKDLFCRFWIGIGLGIWCLAPLSTLFQLYRAVSFNGGGNRSTWRKPLTSFNILYDVYTHNGGVHVHRILMVRWGGGIICVLQTHFIFKKSLLTKQLCP